MGWGTIIAVLDFAVREATLFAACGFLLGGIDDLMVDCVYLLRQMRGCGEGGGTLADFPVADAPGRIAVFIAAWDESAVIGAMLETALARFDYPDYRLYVGVYPNDRATIDAVANVGERDQRVVMVIGCEDGPTTKAQCLNGVWRALLMDEAQEGREAKAIVLHDAEDVVHAGELRVFDRLIGPYAVIQLPVMPLVDPRGALVSGHYCDEFSESHGKALVVRQALGAGLPLAGVGCAISRQTLGRIASARGGVPFDADSLTEDYELGLHIAQLGGRGILARVRERRGGPLVAVRAYFPARLDAAVRQKARWMTGIALAGWDRVGWARLWQWREHWMRMRDRRALLAVVLLATAYVALVGWGVSLALHALLGVPAPPIGDAMRVLLWCNGMLLCWRLAMRATFTGREYGWRAAFLSLLRLPVAQLIALLAARRAVSRYIGMLRGGAIAWEKTAHDFPDMVQAPDVA